MKVFRISGILSWLLVLLLTQGCGNPQDIQNMAYVTAIGIDYKNGKYITYVQVLNFVNVARTENAQTGKEVPVWIGSGDGDTVAGSLTSINATSQMRLFWGHVKAVIVTENLLRKGVVETYKALNRYREVRYNILVYGTKEKMKDILSQKSLFNLSPLDTVMFTAAQMNSQKMYILPLTGNRIIANLNEPGEPAMMPSIAIDHKNWSEDEKDKPMFKISGAYFFRKNKMNAWMSEEDLKGARWTERSLEQTPIRIPEVGPPIAVLIMIHPKLTVEPVELGDSAHFDLKVQVHGDVIELIQESSIKELEEKAQIAIREEIEATYQKALKVKCDPFTLRETLYRKNPRKFHELNKENSFFLQKDSIRHIKVTVHLDSTGKYKGKKSF